MARTITDHQLLLKLVPDIHAKMESLRSGEPDLYKELCEAVMSEKGWKPLHYLQGFD